MRLPICLAELGSCYLERLRSAVGSERYDGEAWLHADRALLKSMVGLVLGVKLWSVLQESRQADAEVRGCAGQAGQCAS